MRNKFVPFYKFECKKCSHVYEDLIPYDETGKYSSVICPQCQSNKKNQLPALCAVKFTNPKDSSKWDSFTYRAGYLMDKAKEERREAEDKSHMGTSEEIYGPEENLDNVDFI